MRTIVLLISTVVFAAIAILSFAWGTFTSQLSVPISAGNTEETIVIVPVDTSLEKLLEILGEAGLVERTKWLDAYAKHFHEGQPFKPGEYALSKSMTPVQQLDVIHAVLSDVCFRG